MNPYLVILILKPTAKQVHDDGAVPTIVGGLQVVMATSESNAAMKAMKFVPDEYADKTDRLEVQILPFRQAAR